MKQSLIAILALLWVSGLQITGSEVNGFGNQVIVSTAGVCLFAVSSLGLTCILRR